MQIIYLIAEGGQNLKMGQFADKHRKYLLKVFDCQLGNILRTNLSTGNQKGLPPPYIDSAGKPFEFQA